MRKLPMFETYDSETENFDFEWPTKAQLKLLTSARQLKLKEVRY